MANMLEQMRRAKADLDGKEPRPLDEVIRELEQWRAMQPQPIPAQSKER